MVSLRKKIRRLLVLFGIASFTVVAILAAIIEYQMLRKDLAQAMNKHSKVLRTLLEKNLQGEAIFMAQFAESWRNTYNGSTLEVFVQDIHLHGQENILYILDADNRIEAISAAFSNFIGLDFSHLPYLRDRRSISSVHQSLFSSRSVISLTQKLHDNRLLVQEKNTSDLIPQIALFGQQELIPDGQLFVLSSDGTIVYHPDEELVRSRHNLGLELISQSPRDQRGLRSYEIRGRRFLVYEEELHTPSGWKVYFATPLRTLLEKAVWEILVQFGILLLVFTSLLIALVMLLNRFFSTPMADIVRSLDVYTGSRDQLVIPESKSRGIREFARIIDAVNSMTAKLRNSQEELEAREQLYRTMMEYAVDWVFWLDQAGGIRYISPSCERITGYSQEEFYQEPALIRNIIHADDQQQWDEHRDQLSAGGESTPLDFRIHTKNRGVRWIRHFCGPIMSSNDQNLGHRGNNIDITDQKHAEQELYNNAFYDRLTGLANRNLFLDRLKRALARRTREPFDFAVLFLDMDRFKVVNDSLGHLLGDQLLAAVAERLQEECRPMDTVARLGGDEFAFLLVDVSDPVALEQFCQRIHERFKRPFQLDGHEVFSGVSIGVTFSNDDHMEPKDLLRDADTAMYHAKSSGRGRTKSFTSQMHLRAMERLSLETDLRRAVERMEIHNQYQPIVSLATGALVGLEVLARWEHPQRGVVAPMDFIPLAEETGVIASLGQNTIKMACKYLEAWQKSIVRNPPLFVNINISGLQLAESDLPETLTRILNNYTLAPKSLRLELTESILLEHTGTVYEVLQQLTTMGLSLYMDDFGSGYSSLSCLCRFPFSAVKIDKEFISAMPHSQRDKNIVRAILDMAQGLNLETVAEGIETSEQLHMLKELGCEFGQGYLLAKPMDAESVDALLLGPPLVEADNMDRNPLFSDRGS